MIVVLDAHYKTRVPTTVDWRRLIFWMFAPVRHSLIKNIRPHQTGRQLSGGFLISLCWLRVLNRPTVRVFFGWLFSLVNRCRREIEVSKSSRSWGLTHSVSFFNFCSFAVDSYNFAAKQLSREFHQILSVLEMVERLVCLASLPTIHYCTWESIVKKYSKVSHTHT